VKYAKEICEKQVPGLLNVGEQHQVSCHFAAKLSLTGITR